MKNNKTAESCSTGPSINVLVRLIPGLLRRLSALILLLLTGTNAQAQILQGMEEAAAAGYLPPLFPGPWVSVELRNIHPRSGYDVQRLGDINDDGYDDFAFRSFYISDSIYIYLGDTVIRPEPYMILPGGGNALSSGDFNGDGYIDLVGSVAKIPSDSTRFGRLFIYMHHGEKATPEYGPTPDFVLFGDSVYFAWGSTGEPKIAAGDYNGDGFADIAFHTAGPPTGGRWHKQGGVVLIKGARKFRAEVSEIFWEHDDPWSGPYDGLWAADITGDGKDELFAHGGKITGGAVLFIYKGTSSEALGESFEATVLPELDPICLENTVIGIQFCDVNNDGIDDIIGWDGDGPDRPERSIIWGRPQLPERFVKDALYPNPDPEKKYLIHCYGVYPLGDIDGDGMRDYSVAYTVGSNVLWTNFLYSGRLGWQAKAVAYYGMDQEVARVHGKPCDIGDVNGDGYDDIFHEGYGGGSRFMIYLGRSMKPTSVEVPSETMAMQFDLYPNPARVGDAISVEVFGAEGGELYLYDMLGRTTLHNTVGTGALLESTSLQAGMYVAVLHTAQGIARSVFVQY